MVLGSERLGKVITAKIVFDKKGIHPVEAAPNKGISHLPPKHLICLETRSIVTGPVPDELRSVFRCPMDVWWYLGIIL